MRSRSLVPTMLALAVAVGSCTSSTEPPKVTAVQLAPGAVALDAIGAVQTMVATVLDQRSAPMSGTGLTWSSSAPGVATVSPVGAVAALMNGTATITATVAGKFASVQVTVAQVPLAPVAVSGNAQTGTIQTQLANALQVRIEDRLGNAMAAQSVTFLVTSGGGSITTTSVNSDAGGLASTRWTLGTSTAVFQRVSAAVAGNATVTFFTADPLAGPAVSMFAAPGVNADAQLAKFGTAVAINPAVQVVDVLGNGVAGAAVTWSVLSGGGSITGANSVTNASGVATVGSWTLGTPLGANSIQAVFAGLAPAVFVATAIEDPCTPAGATPLTIGVMKASILSATDCQVPSLQRFEFYRFDLASTTSLIIEMKTTLSASQLDPYLELLNFNTLAIIAENDDIVLGVIQNSRIAITIPAGSYLIRARSFDVGQGGAYTLLARIALLGVPAIVAVNAGNGQLAAPGGTTAVAPSVRVTDEADQPVAGITVEFATVPGIGSASGASAVTNASGIASVGSWTLAAGANVLSATVSGSNPSGNPVVFSATGKVAGSGFDIGLRFVSVPTANQLQTFSNAAARWETIITGDIAAQPINIPAGFCGSPSAITETVDDIIIVVRLEPIDGAGSILGSAGPCALRAGPSFIPVAGGMRFDTADLANLEAGGNFGNVILHEMGHVLGVGTIWSTKGLLQLISPTTGTGLDTHFSGTLAIAAFNAVGGSTYTGGNKVPVENTQGGAGTRNSHWRESVLQNELMTGFLNGGSNPLSQLTIASMQDLGYAVNVIAADPFFVLTSLRAEGDTGPEPIELKDDIRTGPIWIVDRLGRVEGAPPAPLPTVTKKKARPLR